MLLGSHIDSLFKLTDFLHDEMAVITLQVMEYHWDFITDSIGPVCIYCEPILDTDK